MRFSSETAENLAGSVPMIDWRELSSAARRATPCLGRYSIDAEEKGLLKLPMIGTEYYMTPQSLAEDRHRGGAFGADASGKRIDTN